MRAVTATCHKLTAGDGYEYLTRQVAVHDATDKGRSALADYYNEKGESPGRWVGSGLQYLHQPIGRELTAEQLPDWTVEEGSEVVAEQMRALFGDGLHPNAEKIATKAVAAGTHPNVAKKIARLGRPFPVYKDVPDFRKACAEEYRKHNETLGLPSSTAVEPDVRARIRTDVARAMFVKEFGREPDERELTGFIARNSRNPTTAVSGFDVCYQPVKSVSTYWAVCGTQERKLVELAHDMACADSLRFGEQHALFSRMGAGGVQQVDTGGFIGAAFTHRTTRSGDPSLHTHVALSAKTRVVGADGIPRWLAVDGRPLLKTIVAMSEMYNSRLESYLTEFLGLEFAERAIEPGKRPVREIVGISPKLMQFWSKRAQMIDQKLGELTIKFQQEVGREPTAAEAYDLAQRATLETRQAKKEARSFAEDRHIWHKEAVRVLGSEKALTTMLTGSTGRIRRRQIAGRVDEQWINEHAQAILATMAESRAKWQFAHVHAEAWRIARAENVAHQSDIADRLTTAALERSIRVASSSLDGDLNEPDFLRRRNGESVYTTHGTDMYTSADIVAAEKRILAAAHATGGRSLDSRTIEMALLEHAANNDFALNAGQAALVRQLGASSARVRLALAPAGTGKTASMSVLARAWSDSGGTIIGLAPTAAAAKVLSEDIGTTADTLAKYVDCVNNPDHPIPKWFDKIDRKTLIVVDEAGMAGTLDLDTLVAHAQARGASVVLIGDDQQLASISAGGVLRDIAHDTGAVTLTTLVRFADAAEGAAGLALRDGDASGIGFYIDHDRVHVGSDAAAADMAYTAWQADREAGLDTIMLAPTVATVTELNSRARADRITRDGVQGRILTLADGTQVSAGDTVFTRKNARWLKISRTDHVRNRYRWTVEQVHRDGSLTVRQILPDHKQGARVRLPADYAAARVTLGYAATVHAAQGLTVMTCHLVGGMSLTRQLLYVALTRGRRNNHIYFSTAEHDPHKIISRRALLPDTAVDVLTNILARDGAQQSATTSAREAQNPFTRLAHASSAYADAVGSCSERRLGADAMTVIDRGAEHALTHLTEAAAWPALRKQLAIIALDEGSPHDAVAILRNAIGERELGTAADQAAVLHWRIHPRLGGGPLPWLPAIPSTLREHPEQGEYLHSRYGRVHELANAVHTAAIAWTASTAPAWARAIHAVDPQLAARIAVFRAACGVDDADRRLTGPEQYAVAVRAYQQSLAAAAEAALHGVEAADSRWRAHAERIEPRILQDPFWPNLAEHLDAAHRAGLNVPQLLAAVAERPLPDELPAAALWWRLSRELAPATAATAHSYQRPDWTPHLYRLLGAPLAEYTLADPAWPSLVAAIESADRKQWQPTELLNAAHDLLVAGARGNHVRPNEWAQALTWRVELLLSHNADLDVHHVHEEPLSVEQEEQAAAQHPDPLSPDVAAPVTVVPDHSVDDAYLASLEDLAPPEEFDLAAEAFEHDEHPADELGALDFADLSPQRPAAITPDLIELWATERALTQQVDELVAAHDHPSHWATPHLLALKDRYGQLLAESQRQAPHHEAIATAYQAWLAADLALQQAQAVADHAARTGTPLPADAVDVRGADEHEQRTRQILDAARVNLDEFLAGADPVTDEMLTELVEDALQADRRLLDETRNKLARTQTQARNAEMGAAHAHAAAHRGQDSQALDELTRTRLEYTLLEDAAHSAARTPRLALETTALPERDLIELVDKGIARSIAHSPHTLNILDGTPWTAHGTLQALHAAARRRESAVIVCAATPSETARIAQPGDTVYQLGNLPAQVPDGAVIMVPDAHTWPLEDLHQLTATARAAHAKLILAGDSRSTQASAHYRALCEDLPWVQRISAPAHGRSAAEQDAADALHTADPAARAAAARWYTDNGRLTATPTTEEAIDAAIADASTGQDSVIVAPAGHVAQINTAMHQQRPDVERIAIGWHHLGRGDHITIAARTETSAGQELPAGSRWTITTVDPHTHTATAARIDRPEITAVIDDHTPIELGYAQTSRQYTEGPPAQRVHLVLDEKNSDRSALTAAETASTHIYLAATPESAAERLEAIARRDDRPALGLDEQLAAAQDAIAADQPVSDMDQLALRLADKREQMRRARQADNRQRQASEQRLNRVRQRAAERGIDRSGPDLSR